MALGNLHYMSIGYPDFTKPYYANVGERGTAQPSGTPSTDVVVFRDPDVDTLFSIAQYCVVLTNSNATPSKSLRVNGKLNNNPGGY